MRGGRERCVRRRGARRTDIRPGEDPRCGRRDAGAWAAEPPGPLAAHRLTTIARIATLRPSAPRAEPHQGRPLQTSSQPTVHGVAQLAADPAAVLNLDLEHGVD